MTLTRAVADATSLPEATRRVLSALGESEGWSAGILWVPALSGSGGGDVLRCAEVWRAPDRSPDLERVARETAIPRGVGPVGRAWATGRAAFVGDVARDDELSRDARVDREGFRAAAAVPLPLPAGGPAAGVIELFAHAPREPDVVSEEQWAVLAVELGRLAHRVALEQALAQAEQRQRETEAALHRSEAHLVEADRLASLGTLAAGVAHEINNPLSYVLLNLDLLIREAEHEAQRDRGAEGPASGAAPRIDVRSRLREARAGVERVRLIVQDLKSFSRSSTEHRVAVDVRRVLDGTLELAANEIRHRARLHRELFEVPAVLADPSRLGQVFLNLLVNAVQAIAESTERAAQAAARGEGAPRAVDGAAHHEIRVSTSTDAAGRVVVAVADTGAGIAPEHLAHIFEPFFTTKPAGVGTGLGLSICRGIVGALGGEITVESEPGRGTTFRVVLPPAPAPGIVDDPTPVPDPSAAAIAPGAAVASGVSSAHPEDRPVPSSRRRGRVLVIDDEPALGAALARSIERDHEVVVIPSGREALELLRHDQAFDVILCDLIMPQVTGMDLHEQLRTLAPGLADCIIFMTGGTFTTTARDFLARVQNPALDKPFDMATLSALLRARTRR